MNKKLIIILTVLILLVGGGYFFTQTQRGKIFRYEFEKKVDEVVFELKNGENVDTRFQKDEIEVEVDVEQSTEGEVSQPRPQNENVALEESIDAEPVKLPEEKPASRPEEEGVKEPSEVIDVEAVELPVEFILDVPFAAQAPHGNWGLPYQEACEEASAIIVDRYFSEEKIDAEIMDTEIKKLVAWEIDAFGYYESTNAEKVAQIMTDYFDLNAQILDNPQIEDLKAELYAGKLILIPAAGRELDNPYFSGEGPIYHMLVLIGWQGRRWITNDPGTRHGESFSYPMDVFMTAIHDCPIEGDGDVSQEMILSGPKRVIVVDR
jgi:hypothetical protein